MLRKLGFKFSLVDGLKGGDPFWISNSRTFPSLLKVDKFNANIMLKCKVVYSWELPLFVIKPEINCFSKSESIRLVKLLGKRLFHRYLALF